MKKHVVGCIFVTNSSLGGKQFKEYQNLYRFSRQDQEEEEQELAQSLYTGDSQSMCRKYRSRHTDRQTGDRPTVRPAYFKHHHQFCRK